MWITHYSEIGLKGKNRWIFEKKLKENIEKQTGFKVKKFSGRFLVEGDLKDKIDKIPGIAFGAPIRGVFENPQEIAEKIQIPTGIKKIKIKTQRGEKDWPQNSLEISFTIFNLLKQKNPELELDFRSPQFNLFIEYFNKKFYVYTEKFSGLGGLPVGSSGKGLALLSCGYDSPVASFLMQKRGMEIYFVHFYSYPQTDLREKEAVIKIFQILAQYQPYAKIYLVNILEFQKYIFTNVPPNYLTLFYRRAMFEIALRIAQKEKIKAIITGESLGQVASQTIENIQAITFDFPLLILRPLIGFNKEEIINLAVKIGTAKISSQNFLDCCSLFNPKRPITKARKETIKHLQEKLKDWPSFVEKSLNNIETYHWPGQ